jgi:hypothetical protein
VVDVAFFLFFKSGRLGWILEHSTGLVWTTKFKEAERVFNKKETIDGKKGKKALQMEGRSSD